MPSSGSSTDYGLKMEQKRSKSLLHSKKQGSMKSDSEFNSSESNLNKHPRKRSIRCCFLFHFPVSIVLMIVLLLCNDIWIAISSIQKANEANALYKEFGKQWQENGMRAAVNSVLALQGLFNANVVVAIVDIVFSLIGLAGVDLELMKVYFVFVIWKTLNFVYSVGTSTAILGIINNSGSDPNNRQTLWTGDAIWSVVALFIQFYFLIFIYLYLNFMRQNRKHRYD